MRIRTPVALLFGAATTLGAQNLVPPLAPDILHLNIPTPNGQYEARIAMAADGSFAVTWTSAEDPTHPNVWLRPFRADGVPLVEEFNVSQAAAGDQTAPAIAGDAAGDLVVVWQSSDDQDGSGSGVYGRRYVGGVPTSGEFLINTSETAGDQKSPAAAGAPDGRFVVVWETDRPDPAGPDIVGQLFDASGNTVGSQFDVNTDTAGAQQNPSVTMDAAGAFVVAWQGQPSADPSTQDVFARRFASDGTPLGAPFRMNTTVDLDQTNTSVALGAGGRFFAVWQSATSVPSHPTEIRGRFFQGDVAEGPDFLAGFAFGADTSPAVSFATSRAILTWNADGVIEGRRFDELGRPGSFFPISVCCESPSQTPSVGEDALGRFVVTWASFPSPPTDLELYGRIGGDPDALDPSVDFPASLGIPQNGILESGEPAAFAPTYRNTATADLSLSGSLVPLAPSPPGTTVDVLDANANYGTIPAGATADCVTPSGNCYAISVDRGPNLLGTHWDAGFVETLSNGAQKLWLLHVGETFPDIATDSLYYPFIETISHYDVTVGCGGGNYCSDSSVSRAEMAVFLLKSRYGSKHAPPPATGTVFGDVATDAFAADWIEELAALGITAGCGSGDYCPDSPVTREQMAVFLLKTLEGVVYTPPDPVGVFGDVPADDPYAPWIEDLAARQITGGCQTSPLLYCPLRETTREEMAVFLTKTFALVLYGP